MHAYMYIRTYVCMHVSMYISMHAYMYIRTYVCMHVCMYVCMYARLCTYLYPYGVISLFSIPKDVIFLYTRVSLNIRSIRCQHVYSL